MRVYEFVTRSLEDRHPNDKPFGPESRPRMPAGTVRVDVSDVYDWYKLGQHVSDLKGLGRHDFGKGPPSTIFSFGDEDTEHKYIKDLERTGLKTTDIDPAAHGKKTGQKTDPTYDVDESTVLKAADLVDVFIRGSHRGRILTKLLTRGFPNEQIPVLLKILEKRYGINPHAVVYGPSKKVDEARGKKRGRRRFRFGGYFFPGYSFYSGDSAGDSGGDGGGESIAEFLDDRRKGDDDGEISRIVSTADRLLKQGYRVDSRVIGAMGRVVGVNVDRTGFAPNGALIIHYNKGTGARARHAMRPFPADDDHKYEFKMIGPKHYKIVDANIDENFADGKKPGRKGLARRVGVDCKQPVSKLRSIAKNSSGERQRMAHWCANMKSGKKK